MIVLWKRTWNFIYNGLIFFAPVLVVIALASFLVYCTYLVNFTVTAAVVSEEGGGTEAASAGLVNALMFVVPAIIGGFGIALLFKYRKKLTLKFFFGGALFFAGAFITFIFADNILYLIQTKLYEVFTIDSDPYNVNLFSTTPLLSFNLIYYMMIAFCVFISLVTAYIISSRKFQITTKNYALLFQSALMGAFLSVILPTFTVVILLVALSLYDIYSVRRGPIKEIVKYAMEDEMKLNGNNFQNSNVKSNHFCIQRFSQFSKLFSVASKVSIKTTPKEIRAPNFGVENPTVARQNQEAPPRVSLMPKNTSSKNKILQRFKKSKNDLHDEDFDETDSILTSMTYSSREWDIGIGDLVFYSMLASQPLTPYFISNHGGYLMATFGSWIFWLISICTIIGILIGFIITIRLLERNSMLPGLPLSIALGLTGFLGSTIILSFI